jgi:hypothetical protein
MTETLSNELKQKTDSEGWSKGKRVRTEISLTAKGLCQPSITVELLNQDRVLTVKNPNDIADIDDQSEVDFLFAKLDEIKVRANKSGIKVVWEV